ncbi:reverse transcriptase domain-containing protein, partial [Tanacetum coccineum]
MEDNGDNQRGHCHPVFGKFRGYKLATEEEVEENEGLKEVWEQIENMVRTTHLNPTSKHSPKPNPDFATIIAHQLQNILPQIVTQVTANVNNVNGGNGNGGNDGCSYKTFSACNPKEFDGKGGAVALTRWIEKMESVTQVQARGREAVIDMSWNDFKVFLVEEFCPSNEMEKPENAPFRMGQNQRACNECGSLDHLRYDCPKWKQATGQARNPLALEGNMNTQNN